MKKCKYLDPECYAHIPMSLHMMAMEMKEIWKVLAAEISNCWKH